MVVLMRGTYVLILATLHGSWILFSPTKGFRVMSEAGSVMLV